MFGKLFSKKYIFANSLVVLLHCTVFPIQSQAMMDEGETEESSLDTAMRKAHDQFWEEFDRRREEEEKRKAELLKKYGTLNKSDIALQDLLLPSLSNIRNYTWPDAFHTLKTSAKKSDSIGQHLEAAQTWQAMAIYADAVVDNSSKYYHSYGPILDFGACMSAQQDKRKAVKKAKTKGFKNAAESYFLAKEYAKSGEMWDQLEKHKEENHDYDIIIEDARKAVQAHQLAMNIKREIHYRQKVLSFKLYTQDEAVEFLEVLFQNQYIEAEDKCWRVMEDAKEKDPPLYDRAHKLFETYNPSMLKSLKERENDPNYIKAKKEAEEFRRKYQKEAEEQLQKLKENFKSSGSDRNNED